MLITQVVDGRGLTYAFSVAGIPLMHTACASTCASEYVVQFCTTTAAALLPAAAGKSPSADGGAVLRVLVACMHDVNIIIMVTVRRQDDDDNSGGGGGAIIRRCQAHVHRRREAARIAIAQSAGRILGTVKSVLGSRSALLGSADSAAPAVQHASASRCMRAHPYSIMSSVISLVQAFPSNFPESY